MYYKNNEWFNTTMGFYPRVTDVVPRPPEGILEIFNKPPSLWWNIETRTVSNKTGIHTDIHVPPTPFPPFPGPPNHHETSNIDKLRISIQGQMQRMGFTDIRLNVVNENLFEIAAIQRNCHVSIFHYRLSRERDYTNFLECIIVACNGTGAKYVVERLQRMLHTLHA